VFAPEKPKIPAVLLVGNFLSASTGSRGVCEDLAVALKGIGCSVITVSNKPGRFSRLFDFIHTVWRQRHSYSVAQVDVYSGLAFLWAELVCFALRVLRKPYVLTLHGGNLPTFAQRSDRRVRRLLQTSTAVTAPSSYLLEEMRKYRPDMILLPNPLDLQNYSFKQRQHPEPKIVWLRAFHDIYNPWLAVRVIALLSKQFPNARLTMIGPDKGDGSYESIKALALELSVCDKLTCVGKVHKREVPRWLNESDIFLNTPRVDNTPVSVLEAMACGLCVISTSVGGIPHILEDGHDALLVPTDDHVAMANAVRRVLSEDGLAERLSLNARWKAEQFDWSNVLPKWEGLLTDAVAKRAT
jgi:glycosyltransferase involved in cell wall biosynthesis